MYLQANPGNGKTEQDKQELRQKYTPGENVMPKIELKREDSADAVDRRVLEEIRDMSLREAGVRGPGSYERGHRHRHRSGSRDTRDEDARQRRREPDRRRRQEAPSTSDGSGTGSGRSADSRAQARHLEHQSSLRSLLSDTGVDSAEMQVEILRQIQEEGLLDGVDLDNLDVSQADELSERIADAYRRRHSRDLRQQHTSTGASGSSNTRAQRRERERSRQRQPLLLAPEQATHSSHPPISRPHLFDAYPTSQGHRHRTSSEHRRQASPATAAALASSETQRQAARSATDLSDRPRTRTNVRDRPVEQTRRTTDAERQRLTDGSRGRTSHARQNSGTVATNVQPPVISPQTLNNPTQTVPAQPAPRETSQRSPNPPAFQSLTEDGQAPRPDTGLAPRGTASTPATSTAPPSYVEPSFDCHRCGKTSIQYDLHFHCSLCSNGNYSICLRCYRLGRGCLHWFGFGKAAMQRYERQEHSLHDPLPHRLTGRRYLRPPPQSQQAPPPSSNPATHARTTSDPATRLQSGFFCSNCSTFANACLWKCDRCNDGEWGFCNPCVNSGKCCTHPLLPIAHPSLHLDTAPKAQSVHRTSAGHSFAPLLPPPAADGVRGTADGGGGLEDYTPLTFSTACDICTYPIPPSTTRFHCPTCSDGDYDVCKACYAKLVSSGRIAAENGTSGWRKCVQGHRMLIIGFEDGTPGQRRVVVGDLVGGHHHRPRDPPPNVSTAAASSPAPLTGEPWGLRATALWAYWPSEGVEDELGFPKGAEIVEARDINGDWWEGRYCGRGGLWPQGYARILR